MDRIERARRKRLKEASSAIRRAERPVRVLKQIAWSPEIRRKFFAKKGQWLPKVSYSAPDYSASWEALAFARSRLRGSGNAERFLRGQIRAVERTLRMAQAAGTKRFYHHSRVLYGHPSETILDGKTTTLSLAQKIDRVLGDHERSLVYEKTLISDPPTITAVQLQRGLSRMIKARMGADAPKVVIAKHLSAKATGGPTRIRLRADALFQELDVRGLFMHEVMVHAASSLNGQRQKNLPSLASGHAGTTRTQEGLAVFSELISSSLTPDRLRRLANRVIAVQMACDGADFVELYRFFLSQTSTPKESFEDARRIVRGGKVSGGAPFTKDGAYLDGLLRVHNFLRASVDLRRPDLVRLLFCGRLDLDDIPLLAAMRKEKLVGPPAFLPPWLDQPGLLLAYLTFSNFLDRVRLRDVRDYYSDLFARCDAED